MPNKRKDLKIEGANLWYLVGSIATDGCLCTDGDGGMQRWMHRTNGREQWNLRATSGSKKFLIWIEDRIKEAVGVRGRFYSEGKTRFRLKYGKMAAREIARQCYYKGCLGLARKINLAKDCLDSYRGWNKSKTVLN